MATQKKLGLVGGKAKPSPRKRRKWNPKTKVKQALRNLFFFSPHRSDALRAAYRGQGKYTCAICKKPFEKKEVAVDHIIPVVPVEWRTDEDWSWDIVIKRMFCEPDGLQILCSEDHSSKTYEEGIQRGIKTRNN